ncbi:HAD family hydrolase [Compostimonas suwonensis]|uniref:HAD family hydrolase n=1 Tax=Compostimonas suwonensis TaxID=1048394 RepID=UPI001FEB08C6|nr:HAD family phosphatase [Compostimonas suwonensis]
MTTQLPAAVLWDMDGTLVDTEPYWMQAETELVGSFGGTWTHEDALQMVGLGLWVAAARLQAAGVALNADQIVDRMTGRVQELIAEQGVPWRPGARELVEALYAAGVPLALVTMSIERMARQIVDALPVPAFGVVVAGDLVTNAKPHPEPYLRAAELLGVDIAGCVAIEDSPTGLASATAAGAIAIGVPHMIALDDAPYSVLWASLEGHGPQDLAILLAERAHGETTVPDVSEASAP